MSKITYYSDDCEEFCQQLDYYEEKLEELKDEDDFIGYIELEEMKIDKKAERFCTLFCEFLDDGDCGVKACKKYIPKNGLKGKCVYKTFSLTGTGKKFRLTNNGLELIQKVIK